MKITLWIALLAFVCQMGNAQVLSDDEKALYSLIMEYRKSKNLPEIPLNEGLTFVAQAHCKDLAENHPDIGECNGHSWSDKGDWTPCCYTSDHAEAECMWNKPKEISSYQHAGYEISSWGSDTLSPIEAFTTWKESKSHNNVMLNKGGWESPWKAIGIGMYQGYATVWFGHFEE